MPALAIAELAKQQDNDGDTDLTLLAFIAPHPLSQVSLSAILSQKHRIPFELRS